MFKSPSRKVLLILLIFLISTLIVLPKTDLKIKNKIIEIDTQVGGYVFNIGKIKIDLAQFKEGLDLKGGVRVVLKADMSKISDSERNDALESVKEVISRRVNFLGVSEPSIATSRLGSDYRIIVEIPGVTNVTSAIELIGQTAQLTFKELKADSTWTQDNYIEFYINRDLWVDTGVTGADLRGAQVVFNSADPLSQNDPSIILNFSTDGRQKFSETLKKNINKPIAIYLDEDALPLSMPVVSPELATGITSDPIINGIGTVDEANKLAIQLKAGALPVPVEVIEQKTVEATLGADSVAKSLYAGVVGLVLVLFFMIFNYKKLGLVSGVALILYALIVLAIFKLIPVVLTLPGIAGFVLSIGMAVDANILIFERIKEERSWGKPYSLALQMGFERAWSSIKDSNVSSLITSFVLFNFGTGSVKGFALTLAIGIVVSLFTSIFVTKTLLEFFKFGAPPKSEKGLKA